VSEGQIFDVLGVGFGPSNLALAIALEEMETPLRHVFLEKSDTCVWQREMLLNGSDIQNNPLRDLVTPRNPKSHYTFVNYLKETGRLFEYLNLGLTYPLRKEYARYISWVASHFDAVVRYRTEVAGLELVSHSSEQVWRATTRGGETYLARGLVVAPGRTPRIPPEFGPHLGAEIFHLNHYLRNMDALGEAAQRIAVIGASQSAVEILLDLMDRKPDAQIHAIQRTFGFRLKDTSPFSDHVYFPEFVDYFYGLSEPSKEDLRRQLRQTNYSSADGDVLHQLYLRMYEERLDGKDRFHLLNNTAVETVGKAEGGWKLRVRQTHTGQKQTVEVDAVVLATGFLDFGPPPLGQPYPELLEAVSHRLPLDEKGVVVVERDYAVNLRGGEGSPGLYLNGLCESSHGLGDAGSFSLLSLRAQDIATSLHRRHLYPATDVDREYAYEGA
jgi:L-ornithine N5-oxygenase